LSRRRSPPSFFGELLLSPLFPSSPPAEGAESFFWKGLPSLSTTPVSLFLKHPLLVWDKERFSGPLFGLGCEGPDWSPFHQVSDLYRPPPPSCACPLATIIVRKQPVFTVLLSRPYLHRVALLQQKTPQKKLEPFFPRVEEFPPFVKEDLCTSFFCFF